MSYMLTEDTVTVIKDNRPRSLHRQEAGQATWDKAMERLAANDIDGVVELADTAGRMNVHYQGTNLQVVNNQVIYNGAPVETYPAIKAMEFMRQGLPYQPVLRFIERLENNPSYRSRQGLYSFLETGSMPLTDDGYFLAYKKVRRTREGTLVSIADANFINSVGTVVEMPRNKVDEDPERTCSHGLHVCSYDYLPHFGGGEWDTVVIVKVDPADVVAVPRDYNDAKMRVCRYEVIDELADYRETGHLWADTPYVTIGYDEASEEEYDDDVCSYEEEDEGYPVPSEPEAHAYETQRPIDAPLTTGAFAPSDPGHTISWP